MRSKASLQFAKLGDPAKLAAELGVSQSTISLWRSGNRKPVERKQIEIEERYGVPRGDWSLAPESTGERAALPDDITVTSLAEAREETLKLVNDLLNAARKCASEAADMSIETRERASILRAVSPTISALSKLSGAMLEITEAQIVRSPAFAVITERIGLVLAPYPEALRAVIAALESGGE